MSVEVDVIVRRCQRQYISVAVDVTDSRFLWQEISGAVDVIGIRCQGHYMSVAVYVSGSRFQLAVDVSGSRCQWQ